MKEQKAIKTPTRQNIVLHTRAFSPSSFLPSKQRIRPPISPPQPTPLAFSQMLAFRRNFQIFSQKNNVKKRKEGEEGKNAKEERAEGEGRKAGISKKIKSGLFQEASYCFSA